MPIRFHLSRTAPCDRRSPLTGECCGHAEPGAFAAHVCSDFVHAARAVLHGEQLASIARRLGAERVEG